LLKSAYLTLLSKPGHERSIYQTIRRLKAGSIVELGVELGQRSERLIAAAARYRDSGEIHYTGIDLFEARPQPKTGLALKEAHKILRASGARIRLIPGDPLSALARSANSLQSTDLIVVGGDQDRQSLEQAWFYVPRMLHERSIVLVEEATSETDRQFRTITAAEAERLAASTASTRRAA
jgi:hypothetical protein